MGYSVTNQGIAPLKNKLEAIKGISRPINPKELRFFLGITGWYRNFYINYGELTAPHTKFLRKGENGFWEDIQEFFFNLKNKLSNEKSIFLAFPDTTGQNPCYIAVDASAIATGTIHMEKFVNEFRLVLTFSKLLSKQFAR